MGMILFLSCQKGNPKSVISLNQEKEGKYSIMENPAERGFIIGDINIALVKPGDTMVVIQQYGYTTFRYKLNYGEEGWTDPTRYIHARESSGFYFPLPLYHSYINHCGPLNQNHYFLDPSRNFCDQDTTWAHMRQHQRVWHHAYDPYSGTLEIGIWDDFLSFTPNSPSEP